METLVLRNAFEARSARMANRCAAEIAEAVDQETGTCNISRAFLLKCCGSLFCYD